MQLLGQDGSTLLGIDPAMKAGRFSLRPAEVSGWYSLGAMSGAMTLTAAGAAVFSLRNLSSNLLMVRRVGVGFIATTGFTAAQQLTYALQFARAFTASDTGGTALAITGNTNKVRSSLATPTSLDCRIGSTAGLTAGTKTLDANYLATVGGYLAAAAAGVAIAPSPNNLLQHDPGDYPLLLAQNEGINIINTLVMGAAGVGTFYTNLEFAELVNY